MPEIFQLFFVVVLLSFFYFLKSKRICIFSAPFPKSDSPKGRESFDPLESSRSLQDFWCLEREAGRVDLRAGGGERKSKSVSLPTKTVVGIDTAHLFHPPRHAHTCTPPKQEREIEISEGASRCTNLASRTRSLDFQVGWKKN